jgi:serine/threonine protein kinase
VKVLDFGLAKPAGSQPADMTDMRSTRVESVHTHVGVIQGTAAYMSPEQATGEVVDRQTDIVAVAQNERTGAFSASFTGVLAFQRRGMSWSSELVWVDRRGARIGAVGDPAHYWHQELS